MVYLYGIEDRWRKLISEHFVTVITIVSLLDGHCCVNRIEENDTLIISSHCTEIERKVIKRELSWTKCVIFFENYAKAKFELNKSQNCEFDKLFISESQWVDSLQIPVAKHCNLNCNRCYHFSNLACEEFYPFFEYKKDLVSFQKLNINVGEIRFLGGEPLLNKQILDYIEFARQLYPYSVFKIITNGLLVKTISELDWKRLVELNVTVSVSVYPPMSSKLESLETYLKTVNVKHEIFRMGNHFEKVLLSKPNLNEKKTADECGKCIVIYRGNIGRCAAGMFINDFNSYFKMNYPENNFEHIGNFTSSFDLIRYLDQTVPLCRWCVGDEQVESFSWSQSLNMTVDDYIIKN